MSANLAIKLFRINPNNHFKRLLLNELKIYFLTQKEVSYIFYLFKIENSFRFGEHLPKIYRIDYFNTLL